MKFYVKEKTLGEFIAEVDFGRGPRVDEIVDIGGLTWIVIGKAKDRCLVDRLTSKYGQTERDDADSCHSR